MIRGRGIDFFVLLIAVYSQSDPETPSLVLAEAIKGTNLPSLRILQARESYDGARHVRVGVVYGFECYGRRYASSVDLWWLLRGKTKPRSLSLEIRRGAALSGRIQNVTPLKTVLETDLNIAVSIHLTPGQCSSEVVIMD